MTRIDLKADGGARAEIGAGRPRRNEPGAVKFTRTEDGKIAVTGNPNPFDVAEAFTRARKRKADTRKALGPEKAKAVKRRMLAKLRRINT